MKKCYSIENRASYKTLVQWNNYELFGDTPVSLYLSPYSNIDICSDNYILEENAPHLITINGDCVNNQCVPSSGNCNYTSVPQPVTNLMVTAYPGMSPVIEFNAGMGACSARIEYTIYSQDGQILYSPIPGDTCCVIVCDVTGLERHVHVDDTIMPFIQQLGTWARVQYDVFSVNNVGDSLKVSSGIFEVYPEIDFPKPYLPFIYPPHYDIPESCIYTTIPGPTRNLTVTAVPHADPILTFASVSNACWYQIDTRVYTKKVNQFLGSWFYGFSAPITTNPTVTVVDLKARQYANIYGTILTLSWTVFAVTSAGTSTPVVSGQYKVYP